MAKKLIFSPDDKDLTKLVATIRETWPTNNGEFITAVFFRHDKDGNVLGCMPLVGEGDAQGKYIKTTLLLDRLGSFIVVLETLIETIILNARENGNGKKRNGKGH